VLKDKVGFINSEKFFYLLLLATLISIFFTYPFLKYPYDMFSHLQWIDEQNNIASPGKKYIWHHLWAQFFQFFDIKQTDIFLRAQVIHYVQSLAAFLMLFYASKLFMRNLFVTISSNTLNYLAYWATLIWFTTFSTASEYHHQVWILWYSINYQITLPMTLLAAGLTISFFFEPVSHKNKIIKVLSIVLLLYTILRIHAMEFLYFMMYMGVLVLVYLDKLMVVWKKYIYLSFPLSLLFIYVAIQLIDNIKTYAYRASPIFEYLSFEKLPLLMEKIRAEGSMVVWHYSRVSFTLNEMIYLSLAAATLLVVIAIYRRFRSAPVYIKFRLALFLFITSLFVLIPVFQYTAGFASLLTYTTIVWRFYFSSLLFLAIPSFIFYLFSIVKFKNILILNVTIAVIIASTFFYSKYNLESQQNYYKNVISIKNAFDKEKMSFNLSKKEIINIGAELEQYEAENMSGKPIYYYARDDIAFVIKFIYRKNVMYHRRGSINYQKSYQKHNNPKYTPVLFQVPEYFPEYYRFR